MLRNLPPNDQNNAKVEPLTVKTAGIEVTLTDPRDIQLYNVLRHSRHVNVEDLELAIERKTFSAKAIYLLSLEKLISEETFLRFVRNKAIPANEIEQYICFRYISPGFINKLIIENHISVEKLRELLVNRVMNKSILTVLSYDDVVKFAYEWRAALSDNLIDAGSVPAHVSRLDELFVELLKSIRDKSIAREKNKSEEELRSSKSDKEIAESLRLSTKRIETVLPALTSLINDFLNDEIDFDEFTEELADFADKNCEAELEVALSYVSYVREYGAYFYNLKAFLMNFREEVAGENEKILQEKLRISAHIEATIEDESSESSAQAELAATMCVRASAEAGSASLRSSTTFNIYDRLRRSGSVALALVAPVFEKAHDKMRRVEERVKRELSKFRHHDDLISSVAACLACVDENTDIDDLFKAFNDVLDSVIKNREECDDCFKAFWTASLAKLQKLTFKPAPVVPIIQITADTAEAAAKPAKAAATLLLGVARDHAHPSPRVGHRTPRSTPNTSPVAGRKN